jgi:hypothetical protein
MDVHIDLEFLQCPLDQEKVKSLCRYSLIAIMAKYFSKLFNKKLHKKDLRPNIVIDNYTGCPKIRGTTQWGNVNSC